MPALAHERFSIDVARGGRSPDFAADVRRGLTSTPKQLQPQYFYDALGSALFAAICELPEYYVTRAETEILHKYAPEMAQSFGAASRMIELGSGNGRKTRLLIDAVLQRQPSLLYHPVDVDRASLESSGRTLLAAFPALSIGALCAEYHDVNILGTTQGRTVALFLGSSIGNLDTAAATTLLREVRRVLAPGDAFLIGFDLRKEKSVMEAAYDDSLGVTAAFNLNLLARINRELGGHFDLSQFAHRAFFNDAESRMEMHLVSRVSQTVPIDALGLEVTFAAGETIHTENSYKYALEDVDALASAAGFRVEQRWTDAQARFADVLFKAE